MAIKVKLREKSITGKRTSLYLDFYPPIPHPKTGKPTRREFLGMYLYIKPKDIVDKLHNKETKELAKQIRQIRENNLNKPEIYHEYEKQQLKWKEKGEQSFLGYFRTLANKRAGTNHDNWYAALKHLEKFVGNDIKFAKVDEAFAESFKEYLLTAKSNRSEEVTISTNTAMSYFNKFKAALKQAYKDDILKRNVNAKISSIKEEETHREYLTLEELNKLVITFCQDTQLKNAALFSALTGLRFSDIRNLVWDEIDHIKDQGYVIKFRQQKTKGTEVLPISDQAVEILGEHNVGDVKVFEGLTYSAYKNRHLKDWIKDAGISKKISFHNFRHTYAVLQLANGTDIYTVSKLLGHRDLKTTQIYGKVVDKAKREAADKIKLDF